MPEENEDIGLVENQISLEDRMKNILRFDEKNWFNNLPLVLFIAMLGVLHVANNHTAENKIRQMNKLEQDIKELRWTYMTAKSELMYKSKQSEVAKMVEEMCLKEFCSRNKEFTILSPKTSHHEIINQGINFALTVYGTIAMEYPLLGVPVINASKKNPHAAYNFSVTPKNVYDFEKLILNLEDFYKNISCNLPLLSGSRQFDHNFFLCVFFLS